MTTPLPWQSEFLASSGTSGNQEARVTALTQGGFVVTWTAAIGTDVQAQRFYADGSKNGDVVVANTTATSSQREPSVAALPEGRFVIAWADFSKTGDDTSGDAVRVQVFNADGSKSGAEILVNTTTLDDQIDATVAGLGGGRFVVAWVDESASGGDTSGSAVRAQVFNADGSKSGGEILVNTLTTNGQHDPTITLLTDGRFVVAWTDFSATGGDTSSGAVRAQVFNADGSQSGSELLGNTTTVGNQFDPSITALTEGRFVVAWTDFSATGGDTSSGAIRAQVFNANGSKSGTEFLVNTTTTSGQKQSSITALPDGRFVVVWTDESQTGGDTSLEAIRAQVFNPDGSKSGAELLVNTATANDQQDTSVTTLADGRFVVTWTDFSVSGPGASDGAIRSQIFDPRLVGVSLVGTGDNDDWVGTPLSDQMQGGAGNDRMLGGAGADTFTGAAGVDEIDGGGGSDTADFSDKSAAVHVALNGAAPVDVLVGGLVEDRIRNIENIVGGSGDDVLTGDAVNNEFTGGAGDDVFRGNDGRDSLDGGTGSDTASYEDKSASVQVALNGSSLVDVVVNGLAEDRIRNIENITGGTGNDLLTGDGQTNVLKGGGGADVLVTLGGADQAFGGDGNDYLYMGEGNDTARGDAGIDVLLLDIGDDTGYGGDGIDYIFGGEGNDTLFGEGDVDVLQGEGGNDIFDGGDGGDYVYGGAGDDFAYGRAGNDIFVMDFGNDTAFGEEGQDYFYMGDGDDTAHGGSGVDVFLGGAGNDVFEGGSEVDYAWGEAGNDAFVVRASSGVMVVQDFVADGADDVLRLAADTGITSLAQAQAAMTYYAGMNTTILTVDGDTAVWLVGVNSTQLTAADFVFI
jgi:Ca2+-binding RTX toxin-like protein